MNVLPKHIQKNVKFIFNSNLILFPVDVFDISSIAYT